ncbi:hypothetical protein SAMN05661010_02240 [Modicisalibacter muralis]|uniref:Uncharacterized protein n=1 Tax=Modicisalibacter muralis TaxID=119000 RepID=A0A1G9M1C9_9GAMM|nr:hypothetical protein [Halomonas muralis]SDL67525.1 hypothetical protein SAMN05661010_02240 [Halomonas muralis]
MQVDAIYDNGRLQLPSHIQLKHTRLTLRVEVPDDELAGAETEVVEEGQRTSFRHAIDDILGPLKEQLKNTPPLTDEVLDQLRYDALKEKYLDRP